MLQKRKKAEAEEKKRQEEEEASSVRVSSFRFRRGMYRPSWLEEGLRNIMATHERDRINPKR